MVHRLAVAREARRAVEQAARAPCRPTRARTGARARAALVAAAARGHPGEHHAAPGRDTADALADRLDDAGALVPEHRRAARRRRAVDRVEVGVADAARVQAHAHLARAGRGQLESSTASGPPTLEDGRADRRAHGAAGGRRVLQGAQLLDRDVAAHQVPRLDLGERRALVDALVAEEARAAGVEDAARRRLAAVGISPSSRIRSRRSPSALGTDDSSASV